MGQNQFARKVGISPATLSAIRHGHKPTLELIRQLADALTSRFTILRNLPDS